MPVTYQLDGDARFIEVRCSGDVTLEEILGLFAEARVFREREAAVRWLESVHPEAR